MYKTIFSKSSTDRSKRFKVITKLQTDENGNKRVLKMPATKEARAHIDALITNHEALSDKYRAVPIDFAPIYKEGDAAVVEYIEGTDFEEHLSFLDSRGHREECKKLIREYFSYLLKDEKDFVKTERFREIFGEVSLPDDCKAVENIDVDMLFANVIYKDNRWTAYDYEWFADTPIPIKYIIYRILSYFSTAESRRKISEDIYSEYRISEEERAIYAEMEQNLQKYIYGETTPMYKLYSMIHGKVINVKAISDKHRINHLFQVFYDFGDGYSEPNSVVLVPEEYEPFRYRVRIAIPENVKSLRIDPANSMSVVRINDITDETGKLIAYNTNGAAFSDRVIFLHTDPQILIDLTENKTGMINFDAEISVLDMEDDRQRDILNKFVSDKEQEINRLKEAISSKEDEIDSKEAEIGRLEDKIRTKEDAYEQMMRAYMAKDKVLEDIYHSKSWRCTKLFRRMR